MKKRIVIALVTGLMVASLSGCGEKTDTENQSPENSSVVESEIETENSDTDETINEEVSGDNTEEAGDFVGAENESIVLYAEIAEYGEYGGQKDKTFESVNNILTAPEDVPVFNGDGIEVGYIKTGSTVSITEYGLNNWARFENPIGGTDYDYLYVMKDYVTDSEEVHLNAVSMAQGIEDYIKKYGLEEANYTFLSEKSSDMEVYEFRMDSEFSNQRMYDYWLGENLSTESFYTYCYETLYIECEDDTDGWIICRIYYKDPIELGY